VLKYLKLYDFSFLCKQSVGELFVVGWTDMKPRYD